jgi:hypothetical protein
MKSKDDGGELVLIYREQGGQEKEDQGAASAEGEALYMYYE